MKTPKNIKAPKPRNPQAYALFHRAGNAGCAVAVDTRPKVFSPSKKEKRVEKINTQNLNKFTE